MRERKLLDGDRIVTVVERRMRKTEIRDEFGFLQVVKNGRLKPLPADDELATFRTEDDDYVKERPKNF